VERRDLHAACEIGRDEMELSQALSQLASFGLCETATAFSGSPVVRVHALLRAAARERLRKDDRRRDLVDRWVGYYLSLFESLQSVPEPERPYIERDEIRPRLPHILEAWKWADALGLEPHLQAAADGVVFLQKEHRLDAAEAWLKKANAIAEELGDRPKLATRYNNMSQIAQDRGNLDAAEAWMREAWEMVAELPPSRSRMDIANIFSQLLTIRGKADEAWAVLEALGEPLE